MDFSFLAGTDLFRGIRAAELERMQPCLGLYEKNYARDSVIYRAGDVIGDIGVVETGSVNLVVNSYWGTSSILSHMERGEIFADAYAAIPGRELLCDVVACEDSTILFLPMQREGLLETHKNAFILYSGIEKLGETV